MSSAASLDCRWFRTLSPPVAGLLALLFVAPTNAELLEWEELLIVTEPDDAEQPVPLYAVQGFADDSVLIMGAQELIARYEHDANEVDPIENLDIEHWEELGDYPLLGGWAAWEQKENAVAVGAGIAFIRGADGLWIPSDVDGLYAISAVTNANGHYRATTTQQGSAEGRGKVLILDLEQGFPGEWKLDEEFAPAQATDLFGIHGVPHGEDGAVFWAVGEHGRIFHFDPGELRWLERASGIEETLYAVWAHPESPEFVYAVGENREQMGVFLRSTDGGLTWSLREFTGRGLLAIWGADPHMPMVAGRSGEIWHYDLPNDRFLPEISHTEQLITGVWRSEEVAYAVTADGQLLRGHKPPPLPNWWVTPSAGPGGSISPDTPQQVEHGATVEFELLPDETHLLDSVGGSCPGSINGSTYTAGPITADCDVIVEFTPITVFEDRFESN